MIYTDETSAFKDAPIAHTLAERLAQVETGQLRVRLALARTAMMYGQTADLRAKSLDEIDAIRAELAKRVERAT